MSEYFYLNLQLFAEGGDGAGSGAEGATGVGEAAAVPQTKGVKANPLANVVYGKQAEETPAAGEQGEKATPVIDRNAEFEKLIKGEYKDLYDARMQKTIRERLKSNEETVKKYQAAAPGLELLADKYGVKADDIEGLVKAIEADRDLIGELASESGMTNEQYMEFRKMRRESAALKQTLSEREAQEKSAKQYGEWMQQAEAARSIYPQFNLQTEMQEQKFRDLLNSGIDVRTAYEVIHKDEIIPAAMQFAAKTVEQKLSNSIRSGGARPAEGGMKSASPAVVKSDVASLTKADRAEIIRRVQRGEKISF